MKFVRPEWVKSQQMSHSSWNVKDDCNERMRRWWWWLEIVYRVKPEGSPSLKYKRKQSVPEPLHRNLHYIEHLKNCFNIIFWSRLCVLSCCFPSNFCMRFLVLLSHLRVMPMYLFLRRIFIHYALFPLSVKCSGTFSVHICVLCGK
jgi:hypothetical protein